jgi:hypothetical protein
MVVFIASNYTWKHNKGLLLLYTISVMFYVKTHLIMI